MATGIATGEVVAGDAGAGQRLVTGDGERGRRLQQTAQPGEILITAETHQLVRDAVQVESMGEVTVKGRQAPIETLRLLDVDRSAAGHERRLDSPMVGRDRPRRQLDEAFTEVRDERLCHLFTILGAAGVGKSRLVNEFIGALGDQATVVRGRCLSYGEGITYWPIAEIVRAATAMGDAPGGDPAADIGRIGAVLGKSADRDRIAERVGEAIGLTRGEPVPDETPWAIRSFLEALAADKPLVVVLDDLQWAQLLLLDLVDISDWSRDAPILLIVLARQELLDQRPAWGGGKRSATIISLEPLNADDTAQLIDNLLERPSCQRPSSTAFAPPQRGTTCSSRSCSRCSSTRARWLAAMATGRRAGPRQPRGSPRSRLCCRRAWMGWEERTARSWSAARWRERVPS